ncbi:transposase ORF B, IS629, IS3 family [Shigella boydii 4444-74]|uniref:Transposase ORF B, IS629, IS3 family n=1 Tax=Shigella boydii 4444-74 TaxID=766140 RepID=I6E0N9_SHIBO|nr:transposase ORF B, IS629, IS3 family [Shigella boydii 4444-74]
MPLLDKLRKLYGVGPVCSELHIAPSTYYHCQQQRHHPDKRSARAQRDDWLKKEILRVYDGNHQVYGVRKVWRQLLREGIRVARCTVARLMAVMGLAGVLRGKKVRTTISRKAVAAGDRVNRQFVAERPDQLWVADFTYVSTWQGFVYVAFIIDVFAGYIVGWRVSSSMGWMLWSRRYGPVDRPARSITVIKVLSMYRWPTHSGLRKPDYWHQQEVQATRMTTRWRRASMVFTKRR